jgi:hypothetical protein
MVHLTDQVNCKLDQRKKKEDGEGGREGRTDGQTTRSMREEGREDETGGKDFAHLSGASACTFCGPGSYSSGENDIDAIKSVCLKCCCVALQRLLVCCSTTSASSLSDVC